MLTFNSVLHASVFLFFFVLKASERRVWNSCGLLAIWNNICWFSDILCFGWLRWNTWRLQLCMSSWLH